MNTKYNNLKIKKRLIEKYFNRIINQTYKLLPLRQQNKNWESFLEKVIEEFIGFKRIINKEQDYFFLILCKMEGLFSLNAEKDLRIYRKIIFQCLRLLNNLKEKCLY